MADAADELRFLAGELRRAGARDVLAELRDALRRAAGPAAGAAQASILAMPSRRPEGTLRQGIAGSVKVTASLGASTARVRITASGPQRWPGAAATLERASFSHPVYGHRDRWARQHGRPGWFEGTIARHQDGFDHEVDQVADRIERRLAGEP